MDGQCVVSADLLYDRKIETGTRTNIQLIGLNDRHFPRDTIRWFCKGSLLQVILMCGPFHNPIALRDFAVIDIMADIISGAAKQYGPGPYGNTDDHRSQRCPDGDEPRKFLT